MIYYAKIGTQLCFTLKVPIRVCFEKKEEKTFVIKNFETLLKLCTNDSLFIENITWNIGLNIFCAK